MHLRTAAEVVLMSLPAAAASWNQTLEPLDEKISKYIGGNPVRLDGKPRASGILDTVCPCCTHRDLADD